MRLDQFLQEQGFVSRKSVKRLLLQRKVWIDGQPVLNGAFSVEPFIQQLSIDGCQYDQRVHDYLVLNKPAGVVSAVSDQIHPTVVDLIDPSDYMMPLFPVGRLDRDATGLMLLTNNGQLAYQLMHPRYHVIKKYEVEVNGCLTDTEVQQFYDGITFSDGTKCRPAVLKINFSSENISRATVEISEGKFHQVKKMFLCVDRKVVSLHRIAMGNLVLDEQLPLGQYRVVSKEELKKLWRLI